MGCLLRGFVVCAVGFYLMLVIDHAFSRKGIDIGFLPEYTVTVYQFPQHPDVGQEFVTDKIISYDNTHVRFETWNGDTTFHCRYEIKDLKKYKNRKSFLEE